MRNLKRLGAALLTMALGTSAHAAVIAYNVPSNTPSNQFYSGLGLDFTVNAPGVSVSGLGVFNDDDNGGAPFGDTIGASANAPLTVQIFDLTQPNTPLATATFSSVDQGLALNGSNFKFIAPVNLAPGNYSVVAYGLDNGIDGNVNSGGGAGPSTLDTGAGAITFVGTGRYGGSPGILPPTPDGGPANRYAAGTFIFDAQVPEPATGALLLVPAIAALRRRRR